MCDRLSDVSVGHYCIVKEVDCQGLKKRRLMDLGIVPDSHIQVVRKSPLGDPRSYLIKGAEIAIRHEDARMIKVELI